MSVRRTLTRNTLFNIGGRICEALVSLVLMYYIYTRVGLAYSGLWGLVGAAIGYVSLVDLGLGSAYGKFIAEHNARGDREGISSVVSTGLAFYAALGVVVVTVGWPCVDKLMMWMASRRGADGMPLHDPAFVADMRFLLFGALLVFAASNCVAPFSAVQTGLQRMGVTNAISTVLAFGKAVVTVLFLEFGYGVRGLLYANVTIFMAFAAVTVLSAFLLAPGLRISPRYLRGATFRMLLGFGWRTQVGRLANLVTFDTDILVIGFVLQQFDRLGLYKFGIELANKMRQIPVMLLGAILPAAADLDARAELERLQRLYVLSTKYVSVVLVPLAAFTIGTAGILMRTWLGHGFETSAWVLRIIAAGYIANVFAGPGISVALGMGRADLQMRSGILAMIVNIALTVVLYVSIGFYGIPIATAASLFLTTAWFIVVMKSVIGVSAKTLVSTTLLWPAMASVPGFLACVSADIWTSSLDGRLPNAAVAGTLAMFLGISYLILIRLTPFLDAFDEDFLGNSLSLRRVPGFALWLRIGRRV
ncbi:MAG: polysaccharide biosynthesis C-terminal domain-containing protein [Candidatus Hydrogenedentes bacterium]|nr:polysaccharide biosynthesis C-terminal domain-containing protein [Candidatus Hydrogenedentota bacterium]